MFVPVLIIQLVCAVSPSIIPFPNGGLEAASSRGLPLEWDFQCNNGCEGHVALDTSVKVEGKSSARLSNASKREPRVYCALTHAMPRLEAGNTYRLTFHAKGERVQDCWFGVGASENCERHPFPDGGFGWETFFLEFTAPVEQSDFQFRVQSDNETGGLWIDDVTVERVTEQESLVMESIESARARAVPVLNDVPVEVDGDLDEWHKPFFEMRKEDVAAEFQFAWSGEYLFVAARTEDAIMQPAPDVRELNGYDSLSIALEAHDDKDPTGFSSGTYVLSCGMVEFTPAAYFLQMPDNTDPALVAQVKFAFKREGIMSQYELAIPWRILKGFVPRPGASIGADVSVSNRDDLTHWEKSVEWTPGMWTSKRTSEFRTLVLTDAALPVPWVQLTVEPGAVVEGGHAHVIGTLYSPKDCPATLRFLLDNGAICEKGVTLSKGLKQSSLFLAGDSLKPGEIPLEVVLDAPGLQLTCRRKITRSDDDKISLAVIREQETRLGSLEQRLADTETAGKPVAYPRADLAVAKMFCGFCQEDIAHGRYGRAREVADDVKTLLDRADKEMDAGVGVPAVKPGTLKIRDGGFEALCDTNGKEEQRPVFLTGYGHFAEVVRDLPLLQQMGMNIIQIEQGPSDIVMEDGTINNARIDNFVIPALERAREHGAYVCLLLSPHYFPVWAFSKWPEIRCPSIGFIEASIDAPPVRAIYERYLRAIIPRIRAHPALHSVCLSNEPTYTGAPNDPWRLPLWHAWLKDKHGTIERLNAIYGADYRDFDDVPQPQFSVCENRASLYDAVRFNQERFAEWHAWMAGIIHEMAPDLPCHAKVMPVVWSRETVYWGTDPYAFAQWSQINGNDCYFAPDNPQAPWESDWRVQNLYYDLQRSMKWAPIFNTENHVIPDRIQGYVSPNHVYASIWQGAVHGQGASTTWCWARTYDPASDFEGLILHRAACTAAMSRVGLDLMRLSREVAALQRVRPRVAMLYSNAALVHDDKSVIDRDRVYEALNFCGVPIGFVADEQAASGKLDEVHCLVLAGVHSVARVAAEALHTFRDHGKRVVACGKAEARIDEYGRSLEPVAFSASLDSSLSGAPLRDALLKELRRAGVKPEVDLRTPSGAIPYGVEWRCARDGERLLVNLVNLTRDPIEIVLPENGWHDLIQGTSLDGRITLKTNVPVLAVRPL